MGSIEGGPIEGICKPSVVPSGQSSFTGEEPASSNNSCGPGVERATVVPSPAGNVVPLPKTASMQLGHIPGVIQQNLGGIPATAGRVAYLQEKFGSTNFQTKLKNYSLHPGGAKLRDPMTPTSRNGWAGVLNGVVIPFQDPLQM